MQQQQPPPQGVVISTQSLNTTQPPPTESVSVEDAKKSLTKWFYKFFDLCYATQNLERLRHHIQ